METSERFVKYWTLESSVGMSTVQMNKYQPNSFLNVWDVLNIPVS